VQHCALGRTTLPIRAVLLRGKISLLFALAALAPLASLPGCGASNVESGGGALRYSEDAKKAYEKAMVAFDDHDWEKAREEFKAVKTKYAYSRWARLAELRIADVNARSEHLAEAVQAYRGFVHDHRTDPEIPYARYRICKTLFDQVGEPFLLPPLEERDQAMTADAFKELRSYVQEYPTGRYAPETEHMLAIVTGRLVRHELYVARYYLNKDAFDAAAARISYALRAYDGSGLEPEAMVLLGETYLKMHKAKEARDIFSMVLGKYSASAFSQTAKNFLVEMDRQGK
jgi:outer membrane protein assembly factor BamD